MSHGIKDGIIKFWLVISKDYIMDHNQMYKQEDFTQMYVKVLSCEVVSGSCFYYFD